MFSRIEAENLFSWEALDYEVKPGISQISGFNHDDGTPEGSGKSSCPNILCWTLYGRIPKDANIDDVIRQGCKSGWGKVTLKDSSVIMRSRKPNDLFIVTPENKTVKGKDAKETQVLINKLIGLDFEAFCQTVYFAQDYPKKFISSNEKDKAAILSEIQDLTIFDRAKKRTQENIKKEETALTTVEKALTAAEADSARYESNAAILVQFVERFEADKAKRLAALDVLLTEHETALQTAKATLQELGDTSAIELQEKQTKQMLWKLDEARADLALKIKSVDSVRTRRERLERTLVSLGKNIDSFVARLEAYEGADHTCPTCGGVVAQDKLNHVFKERGRLENELKSALASKSETEEELAEIKEESAESLKERLVEVETEQKELRSLQTAIQGDLRKAQSAKDSLKQLQRRLEAAQAEYSEVSESEPTKELGQLEQLDKALKAVAAKIEGLQLEKAKFLTKINNLTILKNGFVEVKRYVFQSLLADLSGKATTLASELFEVPVKIEFTNEDEEGGVAKILTKVTLDGNERSIGLLSGGQLARVTLSTDLALAAIVANRSQKAIDFLVLDEPFRNLSEISMGKMINLLGRLKGSVLVVEHNSLIKAVIQNTFEIDYRNGVSRRAS